jgi:hypothetical protein
VCENQTRTDFWGLGGNQSGFDFRFALNDARQTLCLTCIIERGTLPCVKLPFVNREREQQELSTAAKRGGLLVVYGRRRVGKTRLLRHWLQTRRGLYSQASEAQRDQQLEQVFLDLQPRLATQLVPRSWPELFEILSLHRQRWVLCLDGVRGLLPGAVPWSRTVLGGGSGTRLGGARPG